MQTVIGPLVLALGLAAFVVGFRGALKKPQAVLPPLMVILGLVAFGTGLLLLFVPGFFR